MKNKKIKPEVKSCFGFSMLASKLSREHKAVTVKVYTTASNQLLNICISIKLYLSAVFTDVLKKKDAL